MDWNLWDTPFDLDTEESYHISREWQCDFYFGYGLDVLEETALNEKSCIQVLRILISKADDEIVKLEDDLVILQSQLAWADEEWSGLCSSTLREKIDGLDIAIRSLKNENLQDKHNCDDSLQLIRNPVERIDDVLKALLGNYFQEKDKESRDDVAEESSTDHPGTEAKHLVEVKQTGKSATNTRHKEAEEIILTSGEKQLADKTIESRSGALEEANEESNTNPKLKKVPDAAPNNINTRNLSWKNEDNRITNSVKVEVRDASLSDTEHASADSHLELLNQIKENASYTTTPQMKKKQSKQLPNIAPKVEVAVNDSNLNSSPKEQCLLLELGLDSSSQAKLKRQWNANVKIKEETTKKKKTALEGTKELSSLDNCLAKLHDDTTLVTTKEDYWMTDTEMVKPLPCPTVVDYLTVVKLRRIAKLQGLKGYSRLKKADLAKILGLELQDREKAKGKRNGGGILPVLT